ncbi:MAG: 30S ribosomal protein S15 [Candidatus Sulcia muelleri]|uniref:Small ribosomal subunit protein uS15 n=1 Tax=Karelsulcia muelleri (strain GWSS) TaxID=444179 RepID=RS15_KARMG|nr:30S ribosomal protein S15 [Candidatus Karelsulcia muelleri]A8Z661.1 RecName: Full=Small ribosomal subunit protein uS15; AltName: Full=30S ribosomal protein S15 [Candidatus Karelsulcia muelleri GWSS]EAT14028.1 ribosomal protein S15 [Candidatus Karelsulcia muelleri str. Hc (Homalodisca coagulata)]ABS30612.1 30S ribosomal subunit protein S15 [Candidatus Karelsulcia muelleri GWSS]MBS0018986.1 30S ribosomal protein S15 [Candidatus Karelsulcia muelleri]MBU6942361.1 30S ribosomal protein S15 [Cand
MYLNSNKKKLIIKNYGLSEYDTGNCIVQIALLTFKIKNITNHLKYNKKDFNTERSLQILVSKRKKLLKYIEKKNNTQL